jgi:hypothetical protein
MQKFIIDGNVAQAIADYLVTKPYREVAGFIQALQSIEPMLPPAAEDEQKRPAQPPEESVA